ncbi:hypothetical protein MesoLjLc_17880 [Mesorhizobium sp. L-8-10]|jgi:transcription elongation factor Elf1|uniref:hypothetical protein n=1 Tax=Mesorhizobium sp. L-8-10 TaxID=2744523 RepID=UPI001925B1F3|nr:hypothetical protein [Mesorhizobium sp. L-8-10]BCH29858.1 hypothetical protein MesoLjLc_17880 [Mesorhizobium sp. L-8-10]
MPASHDQDEIGVICPVCDYETSKSIDWIRNHTQLECSGCGQVIDIESRNFRTAGRTRGLAD